MVINNGVFFKLIKNLEFVIVEKLFYFLKIYIKIIVVLIFLRFIKAKKINLNKWGIIKFRNEVVKRVGGWGNIGVRLSMLYVRIKCCS